jgi:hypothetical protein
MVEHFHAFAVLDYSGFLVDCGHVIAQDGLNSGNVGNLQHAPTAAIAGWQQQEEEKWNTRQNTLQNTRPELMEDGLHGLAIQYNASGFRGPSLCR